MQIRWKYVWLSFLITCELLNSAYGTTAYDGMCKIEWCSPESQDQDSKKTNFPLNVNHDRKSISKMGS